MVSAAIVSILVIPGTALSQLMGEARNGARSSRLATYLETETNIFLRF